MTETFTASNGARIDIHESRIDIKCTGDSGEQHFLSEKETEAAREYFQKEHDEARGWWRWPLNPAFIAKEGELVGRVGRGRTVYVLHEETLDCFHFNEVARETGLEPMMSRQAARAFFEAHPDSETEPQPKWSTAQVITWKNGAYLPQMAQRDLGYMNLGWWYGTGGGDEAWYTEDALAKIIGDAEVSILVAEDAS